MVEIAPAKGPPWVVNEDHVLTLARDTHGQYAALAAGFRLMDIPVRDWLEWTPERRRPYKLFRVVQDGTIRRTSFSVRRLDGAERYFGFTLTGDGRYLLDDLTVTHNSGKTIMGLRICQRLAELYGWRANWVAMRRNLLAQVAVARHDALPAARTALGLGAAHQRPPSPHGSLPAEAAPRPPR
jgi:hypothetical protein